jgi:tetratricopeptide (TPR) repeat protein
MDTMSVREAVIELAPDPHNPEKNFNAGLAYDAIGQTASAVSFYLRAAEYGYKKNDLIVYASLIKTSHCFARQGEREHTVENLLRQAISYLPTRPEAYFFMAQRYERRKDHSVAYVWASIGVTFTEESTSNPLPADVEYVEYGLEFEKAVCGWWVGRKDESEEIFVRLLNTHRMTGEYSTSCLANLKMIRDKDAS